LKEKSSYCLKEFVMSCRRWTQWLIAVSTAPLVAMVAISWSKAAQANAVADWNAIAANAIVAATPARPLVVGLLDLAIMHAAVHHAVQAVDRRFEPYQVEIPGAFGSPIAATVKAARDVLVAIFPAQAGPVDAAYHNYLADNALAEDDPGVAVSELAAAGILALRANDGRMPNPLPPPFVGGTDIGEWRPAPSYQPPPPPPFAPMVAPWLGGVPPFTLKSSDQYRPEGPR
jgi:hypothetical protein